VADAEAPDVEDLTFFRNKGQLLQHVKEAIEQQKPAPDFPVPQPLAGCDWFSEDWTPPTSDAPEQPRA
jgi:hypothetical protein